MPSSSYAGTVEFALFLDSRIPFEPGDTVLDIGCGIGRMGFIVRDLTDFKWGHFKKEEFVINLVGVDIWPAYLQEVQQVIYSELIHAEAFAYLTEFHTKDKRAKLTTLSHILEHMTREHGMNALETARLVSDWVIVMLPLVDTPQEPVFGNEHEAHISEWTLNELGALSVYYEVVGQGIYPNGVFLMKGQTDVQERHEDNLD